MLVGVDGVTIRDERGDDRGAVAAVVTAAFGSAVEATLVSDLQASDAALDGLSLVAELGGAVVGHVLVTRAHVEDAAGGRHDVANLSPLAVHPGYQRQGIGSALVRAVAERCAAQGEAAIVLQGNPAYYGRLGFEASVPLGLEMVLPSWAPITAAQVLRLDGPVPTGHLVLPAAFDGLDEG